MRKLFSFDISTNARRELCTLAESWLCSRLETGFSTLDFYKTIQEAAPSDPGPWQNV
jgi:hypothetical protein